MQYIRIDGQVRVKWKGAWRGQARLISLHVQHEAVSHLSGQQVGDRIIHPIEREVLGLRRIL